MVVLVGYASEHGSTQGIAERIAQDLTRQGLAVEISAMADVTDVARYRAAVLGSAIHAGAWLPAGREFVERHADRLRDVPVWLFSVSTVGDEDAMFPDVVASRLRAMRKETAEIGSFRRALHVREHHNFTGAIQREHWPQSGRVFFRSMAGRYGDHRNWPAIDAWADRIAAQVATTLPREHTDLA